MHHLHPHRRKLFSAASLGNKGYHFTEQGLCCQSQFHQHLLPPAKETVLINKNNFFHYAAPSEECRTSLICNGMALE